MSLSRIVKKPGNIIYREFVQIKDYPIESKIIDRKSNVEPITVDLSNQILDDAQIEAQRLLEEAQNKLDEAESRIKMMEEAFEQKCKVVYEQTKLDAYKKGLEEGLTTSRNEVINRIESLSESLLSLETKQEEVIAQQFEDTQNKVHILAIEIANKVLRQKLIEDESILKTMIMDELVIRKRQNIQLVEVSRNASELIMQLEKELDLLGINLHIVDEDIDHLIIEGDMGRYDLSIKTQIKNIKRIFNTI